MQTNGTKMSHSEYTKSQVSRVAKVGMSEHESLKGYAVWADTYEEDVINSGFTGPLLTAKFLANYFTKEVRPNTSVLDIGAGTGLVAVELRKLGFTNVDGLDPSSDMLDIAKKNNRYDKYFIEFVTKDPLNIPENRYDALTGCGIFGEGGHVTPDACDEMIRLVKPGGYIVLSTRKALVEECVTYKDKLEPYMAGLESEGKWKRLVRYTGPKLYADRDAIVFVYQVL